MNYKAFPESHWIKIKQTLADLKKQGHGPLYAAFDADGTLWDTDLGENFFQYEIDQKCVPLPKNAWEHYQELKKKDNDPRDAYVWLAQINKSCELPVVRGWSQQAFNKIQPMPIFSEQKKLIELLLENHVQVFVVTASISWAVEPGVAALGLKPENVIGVETVVSENKITDLPILPITYKQGKAEALLKRTKGIRPFLACGNTTGDTDLLISATHIQLAVSAASRDDKLFQTESELFKLAEKNNWLTHRFV